ncbi:MAG TPA: hypothetical protein VMT44_00335 [Methanoregula sp.]|nr:hypothetical protein [Methanoregula sp.]
MDAYTPPTSPIKDFIQATLAQIGESLPEGAIVDGQIRFEMSTVVQREESGSVDVRVINLGANIAENQTQKISLAIRIPTSTELSREAEQRYMRFVEQHRLRTLDCFPVDYHSIETIEDPAQVNFRDRLEMSQEDLKNTLASGLQKVSEKVYDMVFEKDEPGETTGE